jgi:hypothetical protein
MDGHCFVLRGSDGVGVRIPGDSALQRRSSVLVGMKEGLCDTSSSSSSGSSSETVFEVATVGSRAVRDVMHLLREVELCRTLEISSDRLVDALMCAHYLGVSSDGLLDEVDRYVITGPDPDPDPVAYPDSPFPTAVAVKWLELARLDPDVIVKLASFSCMWKNLSLAKTAEAAAEFLTALELAIAARATAVLGSLRPSEPSEPSATPSVSPEASRALALTDVLVGSRRELRGNVLAVCSNLFHIVGSCIRLSEKSESSEASEASEASAAGRGYVLRRLVAPAIAGATGDILDGLLAACCIAHPGSFETCPDLALAIAEQRDSLKMARQTSCIVGVGVFDLWVYLQHQNQQNQQQNQHQRERTDCLLRQICPKMVLKLAMNDKRCHIPDVLDRCVPDATSRVDVVCEALETTSILSNNVDCITAVLDSLGCPSNKQRLLALLKKNLDPVTGIWPVGNHSVRVIECFRRAVKDDVAVLDILVDAINRIPTPVRSARTGSTPDEGLWIGLAELLRKMFDTSDKDRQCDRFRIALCAAKLRSDLLLQTLGKFGQQTLGKFDQNPRDQPGEERDQKREQKRSLRQRNV